MAERLPFGEVRPQARPIQAFIQPAQVRTAEAARPSELGRPQGINTVQRASQGNVQGVNGYAQIADALAPFSSQLMKLAETGVMSYAKGKIEEGYYAELKNQQVRSTLNYQMQQEQGATNAGDTISRLNKVDPEAAYVLSEANPWKLVGRRRALAQLAGAQVDRVLQDHLTNNAGDLSGIQPGSSQLMQIKDQLTAQILGKYGLTGEEPEAQFYTVPKLNQAWDKYASEQRTLFHKTFTNNTIDMGTASLGALLEQLGKEGIPLTDGRVITMADPGFGALGGQVMGIEQDKMLRMLGGDDRKEAIKRWREQLTATFGQIPQLAAVLSAIPTGPATVTVKNPDGTTSEVPNPNRPTWGGSAPFDMLKLQNEGNGQRLLQYEQGQKTIEQKLDEMWNTDGGPGSMLPTDPGYPAALLTFRAQAAAAGYRDIDGYMKGRMSSLEDVTKDIYGPNPLDAADFLQEIGDLPRSAFNTPGAIQSLRQRAREIYKADPEGYREALDQINKKAQQAAETTPGLQQEIDRALLQDLTLPQVKPKVDAAKAKTGGGSLLDSALLEGVGALAAIGALGDGSVQAFSIRLNNLYLRNAEAKIDRWMAERPGVPLSSSARNVLINEAVAETRKSPEYIAAFEELTGKKPGEVGEPAKGSQQGTTPGPQARGVPRAAASSLPDTTKRGYAVRPVMDGNWLHSELQNVANGKPVSRELYDLAKKAGTTTNRYLLEQLRFYPQLDEGGEARRYLEGEIRKQRQGQTISQANYQQAAGGGLGMVPTGYNPLAPGSWLMNMLMPPAAAATMPTGFPSYSGGGGGGGRVSTVVGDKGGLAATVSAGEGGWNSVNYGTTGSASQMKLTSMTIGQVEQLQKQGRVFAVGAYQFTPGVLSRARRDAGLSPNDPMTPENQTKLFWGLALGGKRPNLAAYLRGESNDINAAHQDLSMEWAGVAGPNGRGYYDGDSAGNRASVGAARVRQALIAARRQFSGR